MYSFLYPSQMNPIYIEIFSYILHIYHSLFVSILTPRSILLTRQPLHELCAGRGMTQVLFSVRVRVCVRMMCARKHVS